MDFLEFHYLLMNTIEHEPCMATHPNLRLELPGDELLWMGVIRKTCERAKEAASKNRGSKWIQPLHP